MSVQRRACKVPLPFTHRRWAWVCVIALRLFFHDPHCGKAWAVCEGQPLPGLGGRALPAADVLPWRRDHGLLGRKGNSQGEGLLRALHTLHVNFLVSTAPSGRWSHLTKPTSHRQVGERMFLPDAFGPKPYTVPPEPLWLACVGWVSFA